MFTESATCYYYVASSGSSVCESVDSEWPPSTADSVLVYCLFCDVQPPLSCVENGKLSVFHCHHRRNFVE